MAIPNNTYALLSGNSWSTPVLGYYFAASLDGYRYKYSFMDGFAPVEAGIQQAVRNILEGPTSASQAGDYMTLTSASAVANLVFYSTGNSRSDIAIGRSSLLENPKAYYPEAAPSDGHAGDVWLRNSTSGKPGTPDYYTLLHELGHALGLKHGHEQSDTRNPFVLTPDRDSFEFSVMTYRSYVGDADLSRLVGVDGPHTLMMYDIAALQHIYGANFTTNNTDTTYRWTSYGYTYVHGVIAGLSYRIFMTIWDGGGIDTYDFSDFFDDMTIDLSPGSWSHISRDKTASLGDGQTARGNVFNALQYHDDPRSLIENAIASSGNDRMIGNTADNRLEGAYGNDSLSGASGNDTLLGGSGNDWLDGGAGADLMDGGADWDVVSYQSAKNGVTVDLTTNLNGGAAAGDRILNVEVLQGSTHNDLLIGIDNGGGHGVQLYGEGGNDTLLGRGGGDYLFGGAGNDTLDSGFGCDVLNGGAGADTFRFSSGLGAGNVDTIQDFSGAEGDRIVLGSTVFMDVGTGPLSSAYFSLGAATSFDHHILYHQGTGELFYDVDGSGGVAAIKFAALTAGTALSAANFLVI
jgi:serralysin